MRTVTRTNEPGKSSKMGGLGETPSSRASRRAGTRPPSKPSPALVFRWHARQGVLALFLHFPDLRAGVRS